MKHSASEYPVIVQAIRICIPVVLVVEQSHVGEVVDEGQFRGQGVESWCIQEINKNQVDI